MEYKRHWQACQEQCSMELHCFSSQLLEHLDTLQDHVPQVRGCAAILHIACTQRRFPYSFQLVLPTFTLSLWCLGGGIALVYKLRCLVVTPFHAAAKYQTLGKGAGAAFAGAAATVAASQGREQRSQAASVALYNHLMQRDDPGSISTEEVKAIGSRYGVDFSQTQVGDLQQIYSEFLAALIPTDETPLTYVPKLSLFALCCGLFD